MKLSDFVGGLADQVQAKSGGGVVIYDVDTGQPLRPGATGLVWIPDNGRGDVRIPMQSKERGKTP